MSAQRRKFTNEEKLNILHQAKLSSITRVLKEHKLSYSVFSRWKQQMHTGSFTQADADLFELKQENMRLKKIVADQALELEVKKEQLNRQ